MLKKKRFWLLLLLIGGLYFFYSAAELRMNDDTFKAFLSDDYPIHFERYTVGNRTIRYVEVGHDSLPLLIGIHGAPSSSAGWRFFLKDSLLLSKAKLLVVDRPGYGYSGYGEPEKSIKKQAELLAPILKAKRALHEKIVLVSSSYGGPVAAALGMFYPDLVDGICSVSGSFAPHEEKTYWISYPTTHPTLEWLVPGSLQSANAEKLSHHTALKEIEPYWHQIKAPTVIVHGDIDGLIYPENAHYAERKLVNAKWVEKIMLPNKDHGLPFSDPEMVRNIFLYTLDRVGE